jgi:ubiquitin-conjugating enzyme E2 variant
MTTIIATCAILFQSFLVLLAADLAAGFIHWGEDAYVREDTPLIGKIIGRPNVIHHHLPRYMTRLNWLQSSWDLCLVSAAIVLAAGLLGVLTWHVWLFAAISANANQVHKWSHRTRKENGLLITLLQNLRLVQTPHHHAIHHTDPKNVHYCPITNFLNPLLDRARFWDALEWLLARTLHIQRQPDTSLAGSGPRPEWIQDLRAASRQSPLAAESQNAIVA